MADGTDGGGRRGRSSSRITVARGAVREFTATIVIALLVAFLIRTFLMQPFYIPSTSMYPTLDVDDKIAVSKLEPDLLEIQYADVVVFEDPSDWIADEEPAGLGYGARKVMSFLGLAEDPNRQFLVKRIIGLPGDSLECKEKGGNVFRNGQALEEGYINPDGFPCNYTFDVEVPDGMIWVMGDNRTASADSSYHESRGDQAFVPIDSVQGKAVFTFWPVSHWTRL